MNKPTASVAHGCFFYGRARISRGGKGLKILVLV